MAESWDEYRRAVLDRLELLAQEGRDRKADASAELERVEQRLTEALEAVEQRLEGMIRETVGLFRSAADRADGEIEHAKNGAEAHFVELERRLREQEARLAALRAKAAVLGAGLGTILGAIAGAISSHLAGPK